jgi:hypothetical protein
MLLGEDTFTLCTVTSIVYIYKFIYIHTYIQSIYYICSIRLLPFTSRLTSFASCFNLTTLPLVAN